MDGHANLIAGRWTPSPMGRGAPLREGESPFGEIGSWPTSGPEEVEDLLAELGDQGARGAGRRPRSGPELLAIGERAAAWLEDDAAGRESTARRIGLTDAELRLHEEDLFHQEVGSAARAPAGPPAVGSSRGSGGDPGVRPAGEVALLVPDWSELLAAPFARMLRELANGRCVVLVSDPRAPMLADRLALAWLEGGIAPERLGVLHGLTREGLAVALAHARVRSVHASGDRERIAWVRRHSARARIPEPRLTLLRRGVHEVGEGDDPERAARLVVERAFGRARSLFGQRAGQVGLVHCHERVFARFTECLLEALGAREEMRSPPPLIDRCARDHVLEAWTCGLDEGATLIAGGEVVGGEGGRGRVLPTVFTNLEPHMSIVHRQRPMPLLGLARARSASRRPCAGAGLGARPGATVGPGESWRRESEPRAPASGEGDLRWGSRGDGGFRP